MKEGVQSGCKLVDAAQVHGRACVADTDHAEKDGGQHPGNTGCETHVLDMVPYLDVQNRGEHERRVGNGGEPIAEISAGDDGAGHDAGGQAQTDAHAHHGDADGGDGSPGGARGQGDDGGHDKGDQKERARRNDLQPPVDHRGDRARGEPNRHHAAHGDHQGHHAHRGPDQIEGGLFNFHQIVAQIQGEGDHDQPGKQHNDYDRSLGNAEHDSDERHKNQQRDCGKGDGCFFLLSRCVFHDSTSSQN